MPSGELMIAFFAATLLFAYMPGPALLYTAAQTVARGRRGGWLAALGLHVGGYVHVVAAALGLALLFKAVPVLYVALKFAGAAYLVWLGVQMIVSKPHAVERVPETKAKGPRRAFWQSVTVEALNPKTAIFYLAFLPQFTDPAASLPIWLQLLVLGTIVNIVFSSADVLCVLAADKITRMVRSSRAGGRILHRIGGSVLIALGVNIALDQN
ncbi:MULTISPECIES: LysE family translocator [unclassified Roseovarius]|uniref:LysE family translocator n=1 Tax=unclassified Roseovarius TaxID=2614913 RepID=UPI00273D4CA4|nr:MULTISPECIES: LysE family translocator [unclassified Roseovarius]